jgi:hypothetical protein
MLPGFIRTPMVENFLSEQSKKSGTSIEELRQELDARPPIVISANQMT